MDKPPLRWKFEAKDQDGNDFEKEIRWFIELLDLERIIPGRYSFLLVMDLYGGFKSKRINPNVILNEIQVLEKGELTGLKSPIQNRHPPLKGLWHKHYLQSGLSSMAMNVQKGLDRFGIPHFEQKIREAEAAGEERFVTVEDVKALSNDIVQGNLGRLQKEGRLTGEWIVFAKHEGQNYYLCLATHDKSTHAHVLQNIDAICCIEFPFLSEILGEN